jgi:carotenoid cleavage dioxygenase
MPRQGGGAVRWFDVELCYVFHTLNAYDDGDRVVIDVVRHATMFERDVYGVGDAPGTLDRWTVDLARGRVSEERLDERGQELPRIDDRLVGRRHRYGYTNLVPSQRDGRVTIGGLVQHDLRTGRTVPARLGPEKAASEGVFVPARDGAAEDEGWVLSVVYDPARDASDLVILDATDFGGRPVATVGLPQRVPFGFHGTWVSAAATPRRYRGAGS